MTHIRAVVFDWGNTLMRDLPEFRGPMAEWPRVELVAGVAEVPLARPAPCADAVIHSMTDLSDALANLGNGDAAGS